MKTSTLSLAAACVAVALSGVAPVAHASAPVRSGVSCRALTNPVRVATQLCLCQPCHLCEFSFSSAGCGLIKTADQSLSDGSDTALEQPLLEPEQWFLSQDALTKSRGGVARDDLATFTSGNQVQAYAATKEFFDAAFDDLEATRKGDRILLSGWSTDQVPFKPETDPTGATSSFQSIMSRAVARGVHFHALVWNNLLEMEQNKRMRDFIHALPRMNTSGKAEFIFDDRLPAAASAHHQKTLVIQRSTGEVVVAYAGGVDLTGDRWDTIKHDQDALRKAAGIDNGSNGWLDAHVRIVGPAAKDIAANFVARWNSKTKPTTDFLDDVLDFENPDYSSLPDLAKVKSAIASVVNATTSLLPTKNATAAASTNNANKPMTRTLLSVLTEATEQSSNGNGSGTENGPHSVQVVRTFSCKYKKYEFAPKGENSLFQARIHAIRNAKNYIYIEDQYFVLVPQLLDELLKVLPQLQRVIVVAPRPGAGVKVAGYEKFMFDMVSPIQKRFPNKFQLYTTKASRNLYIHTKLVIVDDVYLSIGSANWNRRSMTSDSEIGANIVDSERVVSTADGITVNKLARDYRLRKFSEHTGVSVAELEKMKFLDAANQFDIAAKDARTIIEPLEVDDKAYYAAYTSDSVRNLIDPQDVC